MIIILTVTIHAVTFAVWYSLCMSNVVPEAWYRDEYDDPFLFSMVFAIRYKGKEMMIW